MKTSTRCLLFVTLTIALLTLPRLAAAQGPMTNGENYMGIISAAGEIDSWTFSAAAGEAIVLSIGELGADSPFYPWIRLYGPDSVLVDQSYGSLTGHISVAAPSSGAYRVDVASADTGNTATGSYVLTLAKVPGAFIVPAGDEGGPMTNGANHPGYIYRGDQDPWTFTAAAGETVSVSIGEVGGDSGFYPWIRLYGPTGAFLTQAYSPLGGKIDWTVTVPGTYTVIVASADTLYAETGSYLLTLARPGPFVVPSDDEGGPMANGVVYTGTIATADLDQWAFQATAGAALTINAAELGGDSGFYPWIRLYGPSGQSLGSSFGATAAQITANAPTTGIYTIVVASADLTYTASGKYSLTAAGIDAPPAVDLGDIAVNFGATYGLYIHTNHAGENPQWLQLNDVSPTRMARGDIDGTGIVSLVATFRGQGVWIWRSATGWSQLHPYDASQIITADLDGNGQDDIICNFPGLGIWVRYNNTTWVQLHALDVTTLAAGNIDGDVTRKADLIANFAGYGVWAFVNNTSWVQIHPLDAFDIQAGDFDGNGTDDLVMNFAGQGIWIRADGAWTQLHTVNSAGLTVGNIDGDPQRRQDIVINFPGYGVYAWLNNNTWAQVHPFNAPVLTTVDLEKNGKDDVVLDFPGYGIWLFKNNTTFEQLHPVDPIGFVGGRFDIY